MTPVTLPRQPVFWIIVLCCIYLLSLFWNLGLQQLMAEEPRRAIISIEMMARGNYAHSTLLGYEYFNKPPLFNWVLIGFMKLFKSTDEWVVRLPSVFSILALGISLYAFVKRGFGSIQFALVATFMFLTFADIYLYGIWTGGEIDIFYALISFLQMSFLLCFTLGRMNAFYAYIGAYLFMAVGVLTKALPSFLFMGTTLVAVWWYTRSIKTVFNLAHVAGLVVFGLLMAGFFYWFDDKHKAGILISNALFEAADKTAFRSELVRLVKGIVTYPLSLFKAMLPWSLVLLLLFKTKVSFFKDRRMGLMLLVVLLNIPVYWFTGSPKLRYIFPLLPFVAILFTHIAIQFYQQHKHLTLKDAINKGILIICYVVAAGSVILGIWFRQYLAALVVLVIVFIIIYYAKSKIHSEYSIKPLMVLAALVIAGRLVFAGIVIPYGSQRPKRDFKAIIATIDSTTNSGEIKWYGDFSKKTIARIPYVNQVDTLNETFPIAYQIPYYYYKRNNTFLNFTDSLQKGRYYISEIEFLPLDADTLIRFNKINYGRDVMLFRY